jgi:hypothetical protein
MKRKQTAEVLVGGLVEDPAKQKTKRNAGVSHTKRGKSTALLGAKKKGGMGKPHV